MMVQGIRKAQTAILEQVCHAMRMISCSARQAAARPAARARYTVTYGIGSVLYTIDHSTQPISEPRLAMPIRKSQSAARSDQSLRWRIVASARRIDERLSSWMMARA